MPNPDERYYDSYKLTKIFAWASVFLLCMLVLMFIKDWDRPWKKFQARYHDLDIEKTRVKLALSLKEIQEDPEFQQLQKQLQDAQKHYETTCVPLKEKRQQEFTRLTALETLLDKRVRFAKAEVDAARYRLETALAENSPLLDEIQDEFNNLTQRWQQLQKNLDDIKDKIATIKKPIEDCRKQWDDLQAKQRRLMRRAQILQRKLNKIDPAQRSLTNQFADIIRNLPVIEMLNPSYRIQQVVIPDVYELNRFKNVPRVDRCTTCHIGIDNPDFIDAPQPLRTHPRLELFVGKDSPHPFEEFGCTVCHEGRGRGTDFITAAHTPRDEAQAKEWKRKYGWHPLHHWEEPMRPLPYVEAGCFQCHSQESVIKGAPTLSLGLHLIENNGCYACHEIEKYQDWPKPGPSLVHIASKTTPEWVFRWIENPKAIKPDTNMPSYYHLSNNSDPASLNRSRQEILAMTAYLFDQSEPFTVSPPPVWGDPKRGREVVESVGCLGCHVIEPQQNREKLSHDDLFRKHGPPLQNLAQKTSLAWIYRWLKNPKSYHPNTKMPDLRLTDQEAADAAAYLSKLALPQTDPQTEIPDPDPDVIDEILEDFFKGRLSEKRIKELLASTPLNKKLVMAGEKLIGHYGCFSCHEIRGFEKAKPVGIELTHEGSKDLHKLDFGFVEIEHTRWAWFDQKLKDPRSFDQHKVRAPLEKLKMPQFHFTSQERRAVVTALLGFVESRVAPQKMAGYGDAQYTAVHDGMALVRQLNCQGCHIIDGIGAAIQPTVTHWLMSYQDKPAGEAQALTLSFSPPNLMGEGKKVQPRWLFDFLHEPITIRPWLKVRMPTYHLAAEEINKLVTMFAALDNEPFPFTEPSVLPLDADLVEAGRILFSKEYFNCGQCHIVGDKMPAGSPENWAPDFSLAAQRLKPKWVEEWIKNPQAIDPSTKMPAFFDPNNFDVSGPDDILDGDEYRQIQALREYIWSLSPQYSQTQQSHPAATASSSMLQTAPDTTP